MLGIKGAGCWCMVLTSPPVAIGDNEGGLLVWGEVLVWGGSEVRRGQGRGSMGTEKRAGRAGEVGV